MTIQAISADGVVHEFPEGTDTDVIGKAMRDYASSNLSVSDDLKGGLHDLGTSVSQGLGAVGATGAQNWVQGITPDAPAGPAPSEQLAGAIQHGDWRNIPGLVGHSALRALPSAAPILGAGAVAGPIAAGAAAGALALGPEAYGRAANNGRTEPTTGDVVGAIPGAAGEALGGALIPGGSRAAGPLLRSAIRIGKEAAGGAIMDTAGQLGSSVGTDKGASLDPYQTAGAALTQGTIGAGRSVPDVAASGVKAASDRAMAGTLEAPATRADAESVMRVGGLMNDVRENAVNNNGKAQPDTVVANSVKSDLVTKLNRNVRQLRDAGLIDPNDANDLRQLVNNQALRSNNTISEGLPGLASLYDRIDELNLPDSHIEQLKNDVRDLNTVSSQSFIKNTTGPFQTAGKFLGKWGGTAAELAQGNIPGAVLATLMGHPAGKIGGAIGSGLDQMMGTNTPPIVLQRLNAQRALRKMGVDPDSVAPTGDAISANSRINPGQPDPDTGLPPNPVPVNTPTMRDVPRPPPAAPTLPPLRVDTPETVQAAVQADAPVAPLPSPVQRLQAAQATLGAPIATPASGPPPGAFTPGSRYLANTRPGTSHADAVAMAQAAETAGAVPQGTAAMIDRSPAPQDRQLLEAIKSHAAGARPAPGGDQPAILSPTRYQAAITQYHGHVANDVMMLRRAGQHEAANALLDIAVNMHSKADKRAARAALPPEVAKLIPDYVVNQGGQ